MKNDHEITLSRLIAADRETIFDAWLDIEGIKCWMCPGEGVTVPNPQIDARVGGKFDFTMKMGEQLLPHSGEYHVIDRPEKLQFSWKSMNTNELDTMVYITFESLSADSTKITLVHKYLPSSESAADHKGGWTRIMECLAEDMEQATVK